MKEKTILFLSELLRELNQQPKSNANLYDSVLSAMCQGVGHRALLLKKSYRFAAHHHLSNVQPHEFKGKGYLVGGVPVSFRSFENNSLTLESITFDELEGRIYGCVVYNECGLIAYFPIYAHVDGCLTIQGN